MTDVENVPSVESRVAAAHDRFAEELMNSLAAEKKRERSVLPWWKRALAWFGEK